MFNKIQIMNIIQLIYKITAMNIGGKQIIIIVVGVYIGERENNRKNNFLWGVGVYLLGSLGILLES